MVKTPLLPIFFTRETQNQDLAVLFGLREMERDFFNFTLIQKFREGEIRGAKNPPPPILVSFNIGRFGKKGNGL